jgi:aryl-alcohol dehydrogenase-like predicted oxidoreductase
VGGYNGAMHQRVIGDREVSAIGLGAMPMSLEGRPDEAQSIRTIHAALDAGVTLIDTADSYCIHRGETGHNERLVAAALSTWSGDADAVLVATKGGHYRPGDGSWRVDGRPEHLRAACDASLRALGVESIGLYQLHRPDPAVPYEESLGALRELRDQGKVRLTGVSNADVDQIALALTVLEELASVQNELSPRYRRFVDELRFCAERGVAFLAWSPLGGMGRARKLGERHAAFAKVAKARGVSPQQVALAWELALAPNVIPIPGASRPQTIVDSVQAADLQLSEEELAALNES